ncbi:MAG: hypothetical protein JNL08_05785 [Planctomycetes bacterium]|nr:hypothetical protein [Planctomycetota bacterium]
MLASLVADLGPLPDCASWLAKLLNISVRTARTYRDSLVGDTIVDRTVDGLLVLNETGFANWQDRARADFEDRDLRFAFDAVPRAALAWGLSTAELRALAVVFGEAVGRLADRKGVRSDAERATLAAVSRRYVVGARRTLAEHGCIVVEQWRACRFVAEGQLGTVERVFRRCRLPADADARRALSKRPALLSKGSMFAAVNAATTGRTRRLATVRAGSSGRWAAPAPSATEEQHPSATRSLFPITPPGGVPPSPRSADPKDGTAEPEARMATEVARLAHIAQQGGDVVGELRRQQAQQQPEQRACQANHREQDARQRAATLLGDRERLVRAVGDGRGADLLAAFGVFDRCDHLPLHKAEHSLARSRQGLDLRVAKVAGGLQAGALVVAKVAAAALRSRNLTSLGGAVRWRLEQFVKTGDLAKVAGKFAQLDAEAIPETFEARGPTPKDHSEHPAVRDARRQIEGLARAGEWRAVLFALERSRSREQGWTAATVSRWTGLSEGHVEQQLATERTARAARGARAC